MTDNTTLPAGSGGDQIRDIDRSGVKTQVVMLDSGGQAGPEALATLASPYPVGIAGTYFFASSNNSTSAQLASGAVFTGVIETVFNQPLASLLMVSDQPMLVTLNNYIDVAGVSKVAPIRFVVPAGATLNRSTTVNGNYFNIEVQNIGQGPTTTFRFDVSYGSESPTDGAGNLPVAIYSSTTIPVSQVGFVDNTPQFRVLSGLKLLTLQSIQAAVPNGFVPTELPAFIGGF